METLEQLKAIYDNKPDGATHTEILASNKVYYLKRFNQYGVYGYKFYSVDHESYVDIGTVSGEVRSLSDIKRIIELMEESSGLKHKVGYIIEQSPSKDNYELGA